MLLLIALHMVVDLSSAPAFGGWLLLYVAHTQQPQPYPTVVDAEVHVSSQSHTVFYHFKLDMCVCHLSHVPSVVIATCPCMQGSSGSCGTFGSPCLASREEFKVAAVELWGMDT